MAPCLGGSVGFYGERSSGSRVGRGFNSTVFKSVAGHFLVTVASKRFVGLSRSGLRLVSRISVLCGKRRNGVPIDGPMFVGLTLGFLDGGLIRFGALSSAVGRILLGR